LKLTCWVKNRHEEVEVLFSGDLASFLQGNLAIQFANVEGRSGPVVAISYVSAFKLLELFCEKLSLPSVDLPKLKKGCKRVHT
jgi:hypothetical protein